MRPECPGVQLRGQADACMVAITPKGMRGMQLCDMCQPESGGAVILATEQGTLCPIHMRPTCMMPVGYQAGQRVRRRHYLQRCTAGV